MGASGSQASHVVEVRLDRPQAQCSGSFFVQLHSAADGGRRYRAWGEPQTLGLLPDDIVTVSIFTAQSEQHFDRLDYEEFAEVYLPVDAVFQEIADGGVETFVLGLQPGSPWLGQHAQPVHYRSAFAWACGVVKESPSVPHVRISIRMLPHGSAAARGGQQGYPAEAAAKPQRLPGGGAPARDRAAVASPTTAATSHQDPAPPGDPDAACSAAVACSVEELTPDEMKRLFQLQMMNKELCARLRLGEGDGPDVEEQLQEHLERLRRAVSLNYVLRAELQREDHELAELSASLSPEQRLLISGAAAGSALGSQILTSEEEAEKERHTAAMMDEIQAVTNASIELAAASDQRIRLLEAELAAASAAGARAGPRPLGAAEGARLAEGRRRAESQMEELEALERECAELEALLAEGNMKQVDISNTIAQQLLMEHEVQEEEIGHLRQILERQRAEGSPAPPGTGLLRDQAAALQAEVSQEQQRSQEERRSTEQQVEEMRHEASALAEELAFVREAKLEAENELEGLRTKTQSSTSAMKVEQVDEEVRAESLKKELMRSRCRIEFYDRKIRGLQDEADDVRRRASHALQAAPADPGRRASGGECAAELEEAVRVRELEAEQLCRREDRLAERRAQAEQALEMANVLAETRRAKLGR